MSKPVVVVDGLIAAGKSTLIPALAEGLRERGLKVCVVGEPVEDWKKIGILQAFYEDPKGMAYDFQTYTFVTRVRATRAAVKANADADVFLLERSVLTDRYVFMELQRELVGPMRMQMYETWWEEWEQMMPICPTHFVYLKPGLGHCMDRVARRAREGEVEAAAAPGAGPMSDHHLDRRDGIGSDCRDGSGSEEEGPAGAEVGRAQAKGGVSSEYQQRLLQAHDAFLLGGHREAFPGMPPSPPRGAVTVVDGALADDDFSRPGPARKKVVDYVLGRVLSPCQ